MAYFAIYCADGADGTRLRKENHEAHMKHIGQHIGQLMLAGPCPPMDGSPREANQRSTVKSVMPSAPNGTRPISS